MSGERLQPADLRLESLIAAPVVCPGNLPSHQLVRMCLLCGSGVLHEVLAGSAVVHNHSLHVPAEGQLQQLLRSILGFTVSQWSLVSLLMLPAAQVCRQPSGEGRYNSNKVLCWSTADCNEWEKAWGFVSPPCVHNSVHGMTAIILVPGILS